MDIHPLVSGLGIEGHVAFLEAVLTLSGGTDSGADPFEIEENASGANLDQDIIARLLEFYSGHTILHSPDDWMIAPMPDLLNWGNQADERKRTDIMGLLGQIAEQPTPIPDEQPAASTKSVTAEPSIDETPSKNDNMDDDWYRDDDMDDDFSDTVQTSEPQAASTKSITAEPSIDETPSENDNMDDDDDDFYNDMDDDEVEEEDTPSKPPEQPLPTSTKGGDIPQRPRGLAASGRGVLSMGSGISSGKQTNLDVSSVSMPTDEEQPGGGKTESTPFHVPGEGDDKRRKITPMSGESTHIDLDDWDDLGGGSSGGGFGTPVKKSDSERPKPRIGQLDDKEPSTQTPVGRSKSMEQRRGLLPIESETPPKDQKPEKRSSQVASMDADAPRTPPQRKGVVLQGDSERKPMLRRPLVSMEEDDSAQGRKGRSQFQMQSGDPVVPRRRQPTLEERRAKAKGEKMNKPKETPAPSEGAQSTLINLNITLNAGAESIQTLQHILDTTPNLDPNERQKLIDTLNYLQQQDDTTG